MTKLISALFLFYCYFSVNLFQRSLFQAQDGILSSASLNGSGQNPDSCNNLSEVLIPTEAGVKGDLTRESLLPALLVHRHELNNLAMHVYSCQTQPSEWRAAQRKRHTQQGNLP